jgi:hypothetical protein
MRAVLLAVMLALAGCQVILGIDDPKPAGDDVADDDIADDDGVPIDAPPIDAVPIDGPPAACNILDPTSCGAGMACDYEPSSSTIDCRTDGGGALLTSCGAPTDCGAVATCYGAVCRSYCASDGDCAAPQDHCHDVQHPSGFMVCDSRCDWVASGDGGCGPGLHCTFGTIGDGTGFELTTLCVPGAGGTVSAGGACTASEECVPGTLCLNDGTGQRCMQLCDANGCGGAMVCTPLSTDGQNALTTHGTTIGVCTNS